VGRLLPLAAEEICGASKSDDYDRRDDQQSSEDQERPDHVDGEWCKQDGNGQIGCGVQQNEVPRDRPQKK
jgi:hypothetical protein